MCWKALAKASMKSRYMSTGERPQKSGTSSQPSDKHSLFLWGAGAEGTGQQGFSQSLQGMFCLRLVEEGVVALRGERHQKSGNSAHHSEKHSLFLWGAEGETHSAHFNAGRSLHVRNPCGRA
jgi:hypothetical protein